jgi:hypothetical protein
MTNTELSELLLVRLYDLAEAEGHFKLHDLNGIAREFGVTDMARVFRLAQALEGRGLITGSFASGPSVHVSITGEGTLFVEQGGNTGVIRNYREHPQTFTVAIDQSTHFHATVENSNVAIHSPEARQHLAPSAEISSLLAAIEASVQTDSRLDQHRRDEALSDISVLRTELARERPRRPVADSILATLGDLSSITSLLMQLQPLLSGLSWLGS